MSPQMRQSLNILQAGTAELRGIIAAQLNSNPLLEAENPDSEISLDAPEIGGESENAENGDGDEDGEISESYSSGDSDSDSRSKFFESIAEAESLQEHLRRQAALEIKSESVIRAFETLAGLLDERGFLPPDAAEIAVQSGSTESDVLEALRFLQACDPAGVGARDFRECFLLQLKQRRLEDSLAFEILKNHYALLQKRRVVEIANLAHTDAAEVERAISEIAKLDMSPAKTFLDSDARYILPDLVFSKSNGRWTVQTTNEGVPALKINNAYRELVARGGLSKADASFIKEKIRDGKFVIEAVERRQQMLKSLGEAILSRQIDFFEKGEAFLKPFTMAQAAEILNVHPTTVSRAVAEKYAEARHKIVPLKFFFSGGIEGGGEGAEISSSSIKKAIAEIVENEDPQKPLSDSKIAETLASRGANIARRTVAKYREELNIPEKSLRKRF